MSLKGELESELSRIVRAARGVEGVVAVLLFGSRSRGDYDEYSDYDLLVIFEDDEVMWKNRRELYERIGRLGLYTQVLTRSIMEFTEKTEPTFLQNLLDQGTILYMCHPFRMPASAQNLRAMAIVSYSLRGLPHKEKMKVVYRLFGKGTKNGDSKGIPRKGGCVKLGHGCFMIPLENLETVADILKEYRVQYRIFKVYASTTPGETSVFEIGGP